MRVRRIIFEMLLVAALLLVACNQSKGPQSNEVATGGPTPELATPTLLPGLPTSTPWSSKEAVSSGDGVTGPSPTPTQTSTPPPPPTATPQPAERLLLGLSQLNNEDYAAAVEQYQASLASDELSDAQRQEALFGLGQAQLAEGNHAAANEAFGLLLASAASSANGENEGVAGQAATEVAQAYYFQAQSYAAQGNCAAAIGAYRSYLEADDTLAAHVQSRIAECYLLMGEREQAIAAYEAAVEAETQPAVEVANRYRLASLYQEIGDHESAVEQYDAVLAFAQQPDTLGEATYLAGTAELLAGNSEDGYARYLQGVERYPQAYGSYQGLVALIDAGYEVDDYQRGVVDYHAKAYEAAIASLSRYVQASEEHNEDAHLYMAWSLEGLGNVPEALEQLQVYIDAYTPEEGERPVQPEGTSTAALQPEDTAQPSSSVTGTIEANQTAQPSSTPSSSTPTSTVDPGEAAPVASNEFVARGTIEKAKMLARAGQIAESAEAYAEYVTLYSEEKDGAFAAWWSAAFRERLGDILGTIERYQLLAELYPDHQDADEALFRAGFLAYESGDAELAHSIWESAATDYPDGDFGAAALLWLLRTSSEGEAETWLAQAGRTRGSTYYPLRVQHIVSDTAPFEAPEAYELILSERDRLAAETWLAEQLELLPGNELAPLSDSLANDGRLLRGERLWRLGERQTAKAELESLRAEYANDPLASYQLALFFRDLGLYRSSILAAVAIMNELEVDVFDAPRFIAGLAYPTYFADLITVEAAKYGYDPLLQFSLVRQESLFESFATSGAAAQGLSQVIPDTGAYIAQRLGWPNFNNEDLYRPFVGIAFGAFYLDQQLNAFDGDVAAALSAYNAGPGNAARWYEEAGGDIDLYVDTVDFSETRQYIERIYAGHTIYRHLYGAESP